ncbi:MAG: hypothetical protein OXG82_03170 [Gammaproteobacteria bacterium]|nr:hypothetical protein [Gammaproteobacteria bacterium]
MNAARFLRIIWRGTWIGALVAVPASLVGLLPLLLYPLGGVEAMLYLQVVAHSFPLVPQWLVLVVLGAVYGFGVGLACAILLGLVYALARKGGYREEDYYEEEQ